MGRKFFGFSVTLLFIYIAWPFVLPLVMGAIIATLFMPWLTRWEARGYSKYLGAFLLTLGITLLLILPIGFLSFVGAKSAFQQLQLFKDSPAPSGDLVETFLTNPKVHSLLEWITQYFPIQMDSLVDTAQDLVRNVGTKLADVLGQLFSQLPGVILGSAVSVVSVYFFLVDGRKMVKFARRNSVFSPSETDQALKMLSGVCRSVILATLVSGAAQASFEGIVCVSSGVPNAALIGVLVFIASFVPIIGSSPITFGVAIEQMILGHSNKGIILFVGALVVIALDNVIRPWFLRGSANLNPLLAFVATLGGLQMLGFVGVFIGPIVAALFLLVLDISTRGAQAHE
jgi:predicted PurR-regulated permease PerM